LLTGFSSFGLLVLGAGYGTSGFLCLASHLPVGLLRLLQCLSRHSTSPIRQVNPCANAAK
jgi:hypothetical protein